MGGRNDYSPDTNRRKRPLSIIEENADDEAGPGERPGRKREDSAQKIHAPNAIADETRDGGVTPVRSKTRRKAVVLRPFPSPSPLPNGLNAVGPMVAQHSNHGLVGSDGYFLAGLEETGVTVTGQTGPYAAGLSTDNRTVIGLGPGQAESYASSTDNRTAASVIVVNQGSGDAVAVGQSPLQSGATGAPQTQENHDTGSSGGVKDTDSQLVLACKRPGSLQWKAHSHNSNAESQSPGSPSSLRHHNLSEMRHVVVESRGSDAESGTEEDLTRLKTTADKLNLKTRRQSYLTWRAQYLDKPRDLPTVKVVTGGDVPLTRERIERVDSDLKWIRNELTDLKRQDQTLARQLMGIRHKLSQLRLASSCEAHQDLLDEATDQMEELRELSRFADFPPEMLGYSPFRQVGVTKMNLNSRRFSTC
ncbi:hypothetical protein V1264_009117 [Littorina saxatilis]